jgi:hypothetical protein
MRNAAKILTLTLSAAAFAGCGKQQAPQPTKNDEMSLEANVASGQVPDNVEIETLPPDESSGTSSGELNSGDDNPDVNEIGNSH